jgi:hypothetical protein
MRKLYASGHLVIPSDQSNGVKAIAVEVISALEETKYE